MKLPSVTLNLDTARILRDTYGARIKGASLYQTMGPQWREIVWIKQASGTKPYVCDNLTIKQIKMLLCID